MMEIHQTFPQAKWGHEVIGSGGAKKNSFSLTLCSEEDGGREEPGLQQGGHGGI